jgi:hypothetical protein
VEVDDSHSLHGLRRRLCVLVAGSAGLQRNPSSATRATQAGKIDGAARDVHARVRRRTGLPRRRDSWPTAAASVVAGAADGNVLGFSGSGRRSGSEDAKRACRRTTFWTFPREFPGLTFQPMHTSYHYHTVGSTLL